MAKISENLGKAGYVFLYLLCCSLMSSNRLGLLWGTGNFTVYIYFKLVFAFCVMFIATVAMKRHTEFVGKVVMYCTAGMGLLFTLDYYTVKISGTIFLYSVWWIAVMIMSSLGVFTACTLIAKSKDYKVFFNRFIYGITPLYISTFIICFLRVPSDNLSTNIIPFNGTFTMLKAFLNNPYGDFEAPLLFFGNVFIFAPLPFILKAFIPKLSDKTMLLIGILTPLFVEGYQFVFKCGDVDIDDVITNFIGFIIGFGIYRLIEKKKLKA